MKQQEPNDRVAWQKDFVIKADLIERPCYIPKITYDRYKYLYDNYWQPYFNSKFEDRATRKLNARKERIGDNMYLIIPSKV